MMVFAQTTRRGGRADSRRGSENRSKDFKIIRMVTPLVVFLLLLVPPRGLVAIIT